MPTPTFAAPNPWWLDTRHRLIYREFVPTVGPQLAEVPGLAPRWVSINVPPLPDLLKTVTARLRYLPDRPRPHQASYVEQ